MYSLAFITKPISVKLINKQELSTKVHIKGNLAFHRSQDNNTRVLSSKGPDFIILN
jgi:hypothetical protein